jgi:hypothetical protein
VIDDEVVDQARHIHVGFELVNPRDRGCPKLPGMVTPAP